MTRQKNHPDQYGLPFQAATNELLSQIELLRNVCSTLTPARHDRVIELLSRLALLGNDLTERDGRVIVRAHMNRIAAGIKGRATISSRQVQNWRAWAVEIGVLDVKCLSHEYGQRNWNMFTIRVDVIRKWCGGGFETKSSQDQDADCGVEVGGSGRKGVELSSGPGVELSSGPRTGREKEGREQQQPSMRSEVELPADLQDLVVVVSLLGVGKARDALAGAVALGLDRTAIQARIDRFEQRLSQPGRELPPGALYNWLVLERSFDSELRVDPPTVKPPPEGMEDHVKTYRAGRLNSWKKKRWTVTAINNALKAFDQRYLEGTLDHVVGDQLPQEVR